MAKLTFVLEDGQEIAVPLAEHITLGRAEDNDVVVDDDRISKRHAELARNADGSMQVFDLDSTAGTFVNGERVKSRTVLHGDRLSFGPLSAMLDLESPASNGSTVDAEQSDDEPAKNGRIVPRRKNRGARRSNPMDKTTALPVEEVMAQQTALREESARMEAENLRLAAEKDRLQSHVDTLARELREWQERSERERQMHSARVEALRAEEARLGPVKTAVEEAESAHRDWLAAIQRLTAQHEEKDAALQHVMARMDQKTADLQRLGADEAGLRHDLESLSTHRDQALAHLDQVRSQTAHDETVLDELRRQLADLQQRGQESLDLALAREDQVRATEKKLEQLSQRRAQIEEHVRELSGTEERLTQALARCQEAEKRHGTLGQEIQRAEKSVRDFESRIATLEDKCKLAAAASDKALAVRKASEDSLKHVQAELAGCNQDLAERKKQLATEQQRLDEARVRREEIEGQCQELAGTEKTLADTKQQLATTEARLAEAKKGVSENEARAGTLKASIKSLEGTESSVQGRLEVLQARENDLRAELDALSTAERTERTRFEEVRQLADEAEKSHTARQQQLTATLEETQQSLTDLLSKLTPLREWKEAMDQLYARLATLPQDSPEARDLWHEIEKEKAGLLDLINVARTQAGSPPNAPPQRTRSPASTPTGRSKRSITGAVPIPGTALETTMRARLGHLRDSVQREETRLEQLRLERTRHKTRSRSGPAAEAILREQSRHLESKIRQEEERHHALQRNLENAQAEEDKRREKLAEMERKLAELRSDIAEAERHRSDLRQQADLIHTELKNHEAALDRVMKKAREQAAAAPS